MKKYSAYDIVAIIGFLAIAVASRVVSILNYDGHISEMFSPLIGYIAPKYFCAVTFVPLLFAFAIFMLVLKRRHHDL